MEAAPLLPLLLPPLLTWMKRSHPGRRRRSGGTFIPRPRLRPLPLRDGEEGGGGATWREEGGPRGGLCLVTHTHPPRADRSWLLRGGGG